MGFEPTISAGERSQTYALELWYNVTEYLQFRTMSAIHERERRL